MKSAEIKDICLFIKFSHLETKDIAFHFSILSFCFVCRKVLCIVIDSCQMSDLLQNGQMKNLGPFSEYLRSSIVKFQCIPKRRALSC
jgi:hypothetical protein